MNGLGIPDPEGAADRLAIADVLHAYTAAIDAQDWATAISVFTQDALLDYTGSGGPVGTRTEVIDWIRDSLSPLGRLQHSLTNLRVALDGDRASSTSLLVNTIQLQAGQESGPGLLVGGQYDDQWRLTLEGWRIEGRVQATHWMADLVLRANDNGS